ncbi:uncharacterized protein RSE6_05012 [Rhynchosporium secalis]|uniref:Uncharacterized protein n=1 Tax=Rhynchosporium secalis TaxID=38038 RepID=A0A1E1M6Q6_RHYSE|nr:uncharacterized protein RSE6_05012 [Rhynchosporium secalis]
MAGHHLEPVGCWLSDSIFAVDDALDRKMHRPMKTFTTPSFLKVTMRVKIQAPRSDTVVKFPYRRAAGRPITPPQPPTDHFNQN